jgi:hypothetical protein
MPTIKSELQIERSKFKPTLPGLAVWPGGGSPSDGKTHRAYRIASTLQSIFPKTYGLPLAVFSKGRNAVVGKKSIRLGVVFPVGRRRAGTTCWRVFLTP